MSGERRRLRLLLIEDSEDDETLLVRHLSKAGYAIEHERVYTADTLRQALTREWDVIVSDFAMAGFDAPQALEVVRDMRIDTPFIVVSGSVSEQSAIDALKGGAHDYLTKGNLARLVGAIDRELREAAIRAERRQMRDQLVVSDRLASIGMLAAGIAHEINNPLSAIVAHLELVALDLQSSPSSHDEGITGSVRDALEATNHLRQIVRDLGVLARGSAPDAQSLGPVHVERVLEMALRMAWSQIRPRAQIVKQLDPVPPILGDESRLAQVFLNLLVNAAHAIEPGKAMSNEIRVATRADADRVVVEVGDTGSGIAPDALARIFEPFYTTKAAGVGTGLGLAITRGIVTSLRGSIEVESTPGSGSIFRVAFPRTTPAQPT
jgi:signal transduction histidine kinase